MDFKAKAAEVQDFVVAFRRDLHMYPEASMQEFRTTDRICEELDKAGVAYRRLDPTGVIAEIRGGQPGKTIALRADIDALSITEKTGLEYASKNDGFMHACGHDTHAAMLLGAARVLNGVKEQLSGTVRFFFQPAEEIAQGAKLVIAQGGMEGVDMAFGIHISAMAPVGRIALCAGPSSAATDLFRIRVTGRATHGAAPHNGADALVAASAIVMNLQTVVSREIAPTQPLVVTVGQLHSGSRFNIVAGDAFLEGTVRSFDVEVHHAIPAIIERIAQRTAESYRCTAEVEYEMLTEVLVNDQEAHDLARAAAAKVVPSPELLTVSKPGMGGEDFAEYTVHAKSAFASVGAGGEYPQHSDYCTFDESAFATGVALYCQVAWDFLTGRE